MANQQQQENIRLQEAKKLIQDINRLRVQMNQEPLNLGDTEAVKNIQSLRNEFKQLARDIGDVDNSASNLFEQMVGIAKEFGAVNKPATQLKSAFKGIVTEAAKLKNDELGLLDLRTRDLESIEKKLGLQYEAARTAASQFKGQEALIARAETARQDEAAAIASINELKKQSAELNKQGYHSAVHQTNKKIVKQQKELVVLTRKRTGLEKGIAPEAKAALAFLKDQEGAYRGIQDNLQARKDQEKEISRLTGVTGALVGGTGALMERLGMRSGIFHDAMKDSAADMRAMAKSTAEGGKQFNKLQIAAKGFSTLAKGFGGAFNDPASAALAIVTAFFEVNKAQTEFIQLTGQSAASLGGVNTEVASMTDLLKTAAEFTKQTGLNAAAIFTPQQIGQIADATQLLGVSAEQARTLGMVMKQTGKSANDIGNAIYDNVDAGISQKVVYDDVLSASDDIVASSGGNVEALGRAASAARKLGMDMAKVNQIADGLMDFESSIGNELEAQLLTGKNINLSKARELALNNDLEGVAKELEKNGASAAEYAGMNRIQQTAMAKAMGMSRAELGKMVLTQEAMANMTAEQVAAARGVTLEQSKQMDVQAKIKKSMDRLAQAFAPILEAIVPIVDALLMVVRPIAAAIGYLLKFKAVSVALTAVFASLAAYSVFNSLASGIGTVAKYGRMVQALTVAQNANNLSSLHGNTLAKQATKLTKLQLFFGAAYNKIIAFGTMVKNKGIVATVRHTASVIQNTIAEKLATVGKKLSNLLGIAGNKITLKSTLLTLRNAAAFVLKTAATVAMIPIMLAWNAIKSLGTLIFGSNTVATVTNTIATTASTAATTLSSAANSIWNGIKNSQIVVLLKSAGAWILEKLGIVGSTTATTASSAANTLWNGIKNLQILAVLRSAGAWTLEKLGMVASTVATYASMAAQAAWTGIKNLQLLSMARSAAFWVAEKVRMAADTVMRWLNIGALGAQATATGALAGAQTTMAATAGPAAGGLAAMGAALGAFGVAAAPAIPIILAIGAALLMASPAIYAIGTIVTGLAKVIGSVLIKALEMIPAIIDSMVTGFSAVFTLITDNIGTLLLMGPALFGIGAGLFSIAAGLGMIAVAGIAAIPALAALSTFAIVVTPLATVVGSMFGEGEGEGGGGDNSMAEISAKLDTLISVVSKGGDVFLDGNKVGDALVLGSYKSS
jgi:DNA-binding transcriptional regulator YdaS (Cro superfamily)